VARPASINLFFERRLKHKQGDKKKYLLRLGRKSHDPIGRKEKAHFLTRAYRKTVRGRETQEQGDNSEGEDPPSQKETLWEWGAREMKETARPGLLDPCCANILGRYASGEPMGRRACTIKKLRRWRNRVRARRARGSCYHHLLGTGPVPEG